MSAKQTSENGSGLTDPMPVYIEEPAGIDRFGEPMLGGVPLARGAVRGGGWFALTDESSGRSYTVEGAPAAYWPDGSVKWLHLCGAVDLKAGATNRFQLQRTDKSPQQTLQLEPIEELADNPKLPSYPVRGGELGVDVASNVTEMLRVRHNGVEAVMGRGITPELTLVGPDGTNRRETYFEFDDQPELLAQGGNRWLFRLVGRFLDHGAREVMQLRLFVDIRRDAPALMLQPVVIFTGNPDEDLIESLTLTVHTRWRGDDCHYGFGLDRGPGYWDNVRPYDAGPRWPMARQVQLGSSFYRTEKRATNVGSWLKAHEGHNAVGWCHLGDQTGGVTAAMRYYWQEYPRGLSVDSDTGDIQFMLYPSTAAPLDLRRYSPNTHGRVIYETNVRPYPTREMGATGIAKSSELMLRFHTQDDMDRTTVARTGLSFAKPCRLRVAPEQFAESRVIGVLTSAESNPHPESEREVETSMQFMMAEREYRRWYGLMDFGDLQMSYYNDQGQDRWAFDDGGYAWLNDEHIPSYGLWLSALRRQDKDWLEFAIEMARHNRDVDTYHVGPFVGSGTRHNINHWGGYDKEWRVVIPMTRRLHYYMTGDPWTAEVIRNVAHRHREFARTKNTAPSTTAALAGQLVLWEMSGDEADERIVRNLADTFAKLVRDDGRWFMEVSYDMSTGVGEPASDEPQPERYFFMNVFGGQHVLVELADLLGHEGLTKGLCRHADFVLQQLAVAENAHNGIRCLIFLAFAYRMTGDEKYREAIQKVLDAPHVLQPQTIGGDGPLDDAPHQSAGAWSRRNKLLCSPGADAPLLVPYATAALATNAVAGSQ